MAQEYPNRLAEWIVILRKKLPVARQHFNDWIETVRDEPILLWETSAIRYATYGLGLALVVWIAMQGLEMFVLPIPSNAGPTTTTADFHVVCSDAECEYHFVIHRTFGFKKFPIDCSQCRRRTGAKARKCNSSECLGRWIAPDKRDHVLYCPICGKQFE